MKIFLLTQDESTLTGLRLAGVDGVLVSDKEQFINLSSEAAANKDIAVLLIGSGLCSEYPDVVSLLRKTSAVITEVPDMGSTDKERNSLARYIKETVGIQLDRHPDTTEGMI